MACVRAQTAQRLRRPLQGANPTGFTTAAVIRRALAALAFMAVVHQTSQDGYTLRSSVVSSTNIAGTTAPRVRSAAGAAQNIELRAAKANGWVSYVAGLPHLPAETPLFDIEATPKDGGPTLRLRFQERMGLPKRSP